MQLSSEGPKGKRDKENMAQEAFKINSGVNTIYQEFPISTSGNIEKNIRQLFIIFIIIIIQKKEAAIKTAYHRIY